MTIPTRVLATVTAVAALSACGSGSLPALPSAAGSAGAEDSRQMASGMWAPYSSVHYSLRKDFNDDLPEKATAYALGGETDAKAVEKLARALGIPLAGKAVETKHDWTVSAGGRTLRVTKAAGVPFSLDGDQAVSSGSACAEAQSVPPSPPADQPSDQPARAGAGEAAKPGAPTEPTKGDDARCAEPAPNPELPTKAAAEQTVRDALRDGGLDLDRAKVTADGGFDLWHVTVHHRLGGTNSTGLISTVVVGPKGRILGAYGMLGRPKALGDYPLVTAAEAVERLNKLQSGGGSLQGKPEPVDLDDRGNKTKESDPSTGSDGASSRGFDAAPPAQAPDAPTVDAPRPAECDDAAASCASPPAGPEPTEPQIREVVLTEANTAFTMVGGPRASSPLHLVPAFAFTDADGGEVQVEAVTDEHLQKPSARDEPKPEPAPAPTLDDGGRPIDNGNATGNCSAQMPAPARDGNQPIVLELCVEPGRAKVGQEVVFTIKAKDADGSFVAMNSCDPPVEAKFDDEASSDEGTIRCMACAGATRDRHELSETLKHTYTKAGAYTPVFAVRSGSSCEPKPGDSKGTIDIRVEVTN